MPNFSSLAGLEVAEKFVGGGVVGWVVIFKYKFEYLQYVSGFG